MNLLSGVATLAFSLLLAIPTVATGEAQITATQGEAPSPSVAAQDKTSDAATNEAPNAFAPSAVPRLNAAELLAPFLGVPFRADGATDSLGRWVTFQQPQVTTSTAGFNCSGFTVAAARKIFNRNFDLMTSIYDRKGDSGFGAPFGQDWDFGLDLILNLAQDYPHRYLPEPPDRNATPVLEGDDDGRPLGWGVDIHQAAFLELLAQLKEGSVSFFVLSRPDRRFPIGLSYYHVGLILSEPPDLWLYHTTLGAKTNRVNLGTPAGIARFRRDFKRLTNGERRIFLVEIDLTSPLVTFPNSHTTASSVATQPDSYASKP